MMPPVIGRYEVVRRLGQGGMAALYLARDPVIDRLVALKLLREGFDTQELRERFAREARSAGRLRHPNIVTIFDVGEHDGQPFIAMEYIPGETLGEVIRRGAPLSLDRKLALAEDLCAGLGYAHAAGIVHRDVKPANIMVDPDGILKILDFGIARVGDSSMTQAGMIVGTLNYMSPEQVAGGAIDHRSDIFAVGAVLYELLSGRQAFPGNLQSGILHRILQVEPDPLVRLIPRIDPALARIVSIALQKEPTRRYQDLGTMRKDIAQVRQGLPAKGGESSLYDGETIELSPETPAPVAPRHRAELEALRSRRAREVEKYLEQARRALDAHDYQGAVAACESTFLLDPEEPRAIELLDRAKASITQAQVQEWLDRARAELDKGDLTAASRLVDEAAGLDAGSEQAAALSKAIETARLARERAARADRIADQARSRLDERAPESAIRLAEEALGIEPSHRGARDVIEQAQTAIDARRRDEDDRRAREAVGEARALFDGGERDAAVASLRAFAPAHPLVQDAVVKMQAEADALARRLRQEEEARQRAEAARLEREQKIAAIIAEARAAIEQQRYDDAMGALDRAQRSEAATATITALREQASAGRRAQQQAREQRRRVEAALRDVSRLLQAGDLDAARQPLAEALHLAPGDAAVLDLQRRLDEATEAHARRRREIAELVAEASRLETNNDLASALGRVDAALALDPHDAAAVQLRRRVGHAIDEAQERQRKVSERIARARATSAHPKAIARLRGILETDPANEQARSLLQEREATLAAEQAEGERRKAALAAEQAERQRRKAALASERAERQRQKAEARPVTKSASPTRAGAVLVLCAILAAIAVFAFVHSRRSVPPAAPGSASARPQTHGEQEPRRPETATAPSPGAPEATTGATQPPDVSGGAQPQTSKADEKVEQLRRQAGLQLKRGDREQALATVIAGLRLQPDDERLRGVLQGIMRDAHQGASRARDEAQQAGGASQPAFSRATRAMERAAAEERSGRPEGAVRLLLAASALFGEAGNAARQAAATPAQQAAPQPAARPGTGTAAQPPATEPARPWSPPPPVQLPPVAPPTGAASTEGPASRPVEPPPPPARSSAPPPAASPAADEAGIQQTLAAYKAAYERLDAGAVRSVQPSLTAAQAATLEKTFADYRSYSVQIDDVKIAVSGSKATVSCRITRRYDPKAGRPGGNTVPTVLHLEKRGTSWVISRVETR